MLIFGVNTLLYRFYKINGLHYYNECKMESIMGGRNPWFPPHSEITFSLLNYLWYSMKILAVVFDLFPEGGVQRSFCTSWFRKVASHLRNCYGVSALDRWLHVLWQSLKVLKPAVDHFNLQPVFIFLLFTIITMHLLVANCRRLVLLWIKGCKCLRSSWRGVSGYC